LATIICTYPILRILPNLSQISLRKKANEFILSQEEREAFKQLKATLCDAHSLYVPIPGQLYILQTDASGFAVGATLGQMDPYPKCVVYH